MADESIDVKLARLDERLNTLIEQNKAASEARKQQYEFNETVRASLAKLTEQMANASPTIEEFITIKHKVVGAGTLGKWLWVAGGVIIGFVFSARGGLIAWIKTL